MELLQTLRRIRACEGEAAAQLLLEAYVAQEVAAERTALVALAATQGWSMVNDSPFADALRELCDTRERA